MLPAFAVVAGCTLLLARSVFADGPIGKVDSDAQKIAKSLLGNKIKEVPPPSLWGRMVNLIEYATVGETRFKKLKDQVETNPKDPLKPQEDAPFSWKDVVLKGFENLGFKPQPHIPPPPDPNARKDDDMDSLGEDEAGALVPSTLRSSPSSGSSSGGIMPSWFGSRSKQPDFSSISVTSNLSHVEVLDDPDRDSLGKAFFDLKEALAREGVIPRGKNIKLTVLIDSEEATYYIEQPGKDSTPVKFDFLQAKSKSSLIRQKFKKIKDEYHRVLKNNLEKEIEEEIQSLDDYSDADSVSLKYEKGRYQVVIVRDGKTQTKDLSKAHPEIHQKIMGNLNRIQSHVIYQKDASQCLLARYSTPDLQQFSLDLAGKLKRKSNSLSSWFKPRKKNDAEEALESFYSEINLYKDQRLVERKNFLERLKGTNNPHDFNEILSSKKTKKTSQEVKELDQLQNFLEQEFLKFLDEKIKQCTEPEQKERLTKRKEVLAKFSKIRTESNSPQEAEEEINKLSKKDKEFFMKGSPSYRDCFKEFMEAQILQVSNLMKARIATSAPRSHLMQVVEEKIADLEKEVLLYKKVLKKQKGTSGEAVAEKNLENSIKTLKRCRNQKFFLDLMEKTPLAKAIADFWGADFANMRDSKDLEPQLRAKFSELCNESISLGQGWDTKKCQHVWEIFAFVAISCVPQKQRKLVKGVLNKIILENRGQIIKEVPHKVDLKKGVDLYSFGFLESLMS